MQVLKFAILLLANTQIWAIAPNTPVTNEAFVSYRTGGSAYNTSAVVTLLADPAAGNSAPFGITLDNAAFDENTPGAVVGLLTVADPDLLDTHTLVVDDPRFEIVGGELRLLPGESFDFETTPLVNVTVTATDPEGASFAQTLTLTINNVNEAPTGLTLDDTTVVVNRPGAVVGELTIIDPDAGDTHTLPVDDPRFVVDGTTLRLADLESLPLGAVVTVNVTVTDAGGLSFVQPFTVTAVPPVAGADATIRILRADATQPLQPVATTQCDAGGGFAPITDTRTALGEVLTLPGDLGLSLAVAAKGGATLLVQVSDPDANLDAAEQDQIEIVLQSANGDTETLQVQETTVDSGVFTGYINTALTTATTDNCLLEVMVNGSVTARYTPAAAPEILSSVPVDPLSRVFDSATGQAVDGAIVTLLDAAGNPATVFADDGVSAFPNMVVSGDPSLGFAPGGYRFPAVAPGMYSIDVTPPNRFTFPSVVDNVDLAALPDAPFALDGARGELVDAGPLLTIDIPLDLQPIVPTPSVINLLVPQAGGDNLFLPGTQCFDGSGFQPSPNASSPVAGVVAAGSTVAAVPASRFSRGEVLLVQVLDADQNLDPFNPDTLIVELVSGADTERLTLTETMASSGEFTGYLQTAADPVAQPLNCVLEAVAGETLTVSYVDPDDGIDSSVSSALLDPGFLVFATDTGAPLSGAEVTLIDVSTGLPATNAVFALDGTTPFPVTVQVGGEVLVGGEQIDFAPGTFFYPVILPGSYRFEVTPPTGYGFPTELSNGQLQALAGAPYRLAPGSRGAGFNVLPGSVTVFDIPLDPVSVGVFVSKQASKDLVALGDFLKYEITLENTNLTAQALDVVLTDILPQGFRLVPESARLDGVPVTLRQSGEARNLATDFAVLAPGSSQVLSYVVEVGVGADLGVARNSVTVTGVGIPGQLQAFADVVVEEDLFATTTFIVGRVTQGGCEASEQTGLAGVRVWLEDGRFALTDEAGKYHFDDVSPGTHVVQLDQGSVPQSHKLITCAQNSQFAGRNFSQFVDVQAGSMWRADFYTEGRPAQDSTVMTRLDAVGDKERGQVRYTYRIQGGGVALHHLRATLILDDNLEYVMGSSSLNGEAIADPRGISLGALAYSLPDTAKPFVYALSFVANVKANVPLKSRAVMMFRSRDGSHRTEVSNNELGLDWPAALNLLADSRDSFRPPPKSDREPEALLQTPTSELDMRVEVHEPSLGENTSRSATLRTRLREDYAEPEDNAPYRLPEQDRGLAPKFDAKWLQAFSGEVGIAWPAVGYNPVIPSIAVAVVHPIDTKPHLLVDGELVNPLTWAGTVANPEIGFTVTSWDGVPISEGDSLIEVQVMDAAGELVVRDERPMHFSGAAAQAEILEERSYLRADGLYPPMLAIRFKDRDGYPLRAGTTGEFSVLPPYKAYNKTRHLENLENEFSNQQYRVLEDGIAYIQLEPTLRTGTVKLDFRFDEIRSERINARLAPGMREWIMVGLAEGSITARSLDGALERLEAAGAEDDVLTDGRVAFYAKGMIRGEWLLTAAYDTDKPFEEQLQQQIDPNRYYTLYGDGSDPQYDAQSQQKLYLKLERSEFGGLFGDFDTDFQKSKLATYNRRLNGVAGGYFGDKVEVKAFASDTSQAFVRDEIPGDGTSGIYRLSRERLVRYSETVSIVSRDRFTPDEVLERQVLTRFQDYTIDYVRGTMLMRQPVPSQDQALNPVFLEVEYEVDGRQNDDVLAGARVAYRLDDQDGEIAATYINDDNAINGGELVAGDVTWNVNDKQKLTLELAQSDTQALGKGTAYLAEFEHLGADLAGRVYFSHQDPEFGLGQQSVFERGLRKYGLEGQYQFSEALRLTGQALQQELLDSDNQRSILDAQAEYRQGSTTVRGGLRGVQESTGDEERTTAQLIMGGSTDVWQNKLTLRVDAEADLGQSQDSADYPHRVVLGAEYRLMPEVSILAEQEFTFADLRDTQDTRIGLRAQPWRGADVQTLLQRQAGEDGERLFATTGVLQRWRLTDRWLLDAGFDRVQTLRQVGAGQSRLDLFSPAALPASGSEGADFTAYHAGVGYQADAWHISSRVELHQGDLADKWNFLVGANRQLQEGRVVSSSVAWLHEDSALGVTETMDMSFGLAWRPQESRFTWLNRVDVKMAERPGFDGTSRKLINNTALNFKANEHHQISAHLGLKHTLDEIDNTEYDSTVLLLGGEYRFFFTKRWDLGLHGSTLTSLSGADREYSAGVSLGFNAFTNSWISVGYNVAGFDDEDFVAAEYTAQGIFMKFRLKFDQEFARRFLSFAGLGSSPANASP